MARSKLAVEVSDTGASAGFAAPPAGPIARAPAAGKSIALTLRPLLAPFKGRGRLFLRMEKMPQRASLSAGKRNSDGSWSLASDELDDVEYRVPSHAAGDHVLTIRITSLDGGEATTLKVLDFPVSFSAPAPPAANESDQHGAAGQLGHMQSLAALREAEVELLHAQLEQERRERARDAGLIEQRLQSAFDQKSDQAALSHQQELEAQRAALQAQIAELTARIPGQGEKERDAELIRQQLQKDFDQRFAQKFTEAAAQHRAELEAQRAALQAQIADLTSQVPGPREKERDAERMRQRLQTEFDRRLETVSAEHHRQRDAQRALLQGEITTLTARAEGLERRLQEEQQSREAYAAERAAQIEQELRVRYEAQLEAAERRQETLSQAQRDDIRQAAAADSEGNLRSARDRWSTELAIAVQQAREDWDREQDELIGKLRDEHARHCHDLLVPEREKILMLEAALARAPVQAGDHNAAALQSLNDQLAAASHALADRDRALEGARAQLAEAELARARLESERAAHDKQTDRLLQQERDNWQAQEQSLREQWSNLQAQAEAQIASLTARCREAEGRVNRNSWGTAIQDKARIDALNQEIASLRTALAKQMQVPAPDRASTALLTASSQDEKPAGRPKMSLLRDFSIAVCCITPLILFYPRVMSSVHAFMSDDPPAPMVAAPAKPAVPQAAKARMATVVRGVNMHKTPSGKGDVVLTLKKGADVEILSTAGKWIEVGVKGQDGALIRGWVYSAYLQADGAPGSQ